MKTKIKAILTLGILSASTLSFAADATELCGRLTAEALNGKGSIYFITNDKGENVVIPASAEVKNELANDVYQFVCAKGKRTQKGFRATSVSLNDR